MGDGCLQSGGPQSLGAEKETGMKRCAQCHGKLGLGVRSRNLWNGRWWIHVRYCSTHCEALHEVERRQRQTSLAHTFLSRSSPTELNDAVVRPLPAIVLWPSDVPMAATNKCLAQSNKSGTRGEATKKRDAAYRAPPQHRQEGQARGLYRWNG